MIQDLSQVPSLICGSPGPFHILIDSFQDPTKGSSALWFSPGVANFIISSIMASWLGAALESAFALASAFVAGAVFGAFVSARAAPAVATRQQPSRPQTNLRQNDSVQRIMRVSSMGRGLPSGTRGLRRIARR